MDGFSFFLSSIMNSAKPFSPIDSNYWKIFHWADFLIKYCKSKYGKAIINERKSVVVLILSTA